MLQTVRTSSPFGYAMVIAAGLLYAVALKYFVLPTGVILTGTEGFAAATSYYFDNDQTLFIVLYLFFQLVLLTFGYFKVSREFAVRSLVAVVTVATALALLPELTFANPQDERMLLVLFGGILAGTAKALAFRHRGSTGDEDILGAFFAMKYLRPVGFIAIIAATFSTAYGLALDYAKNGSFESVVNTLMYTCIFIFASAETLNNVYHKFKLNLLVIMTKQPAVVGGAIRDRFEHRTYTVQKGVGGQSGAEISLVKVIITQEELPSAMDAIQHADPACFHYSHSIEGVSRRYYIEPIG